MNAQKTKTIHSLTIVVLMYSLCFLAYFIWGGTTKALGPLCGDTPCPFGDFCTSGGTISNCTLNCNGGSFVLCRC
jgi:hypothetical protein